MIEYFEENLFYVCVQILLIWSCNHGRIPRYEVIWIKKVDEMANCDWLCWKSVSLAASYSIDIC